MTTWIEATKGLWFGSTERPFRDEFDHVLTLTDRSPRTDDGLRHRILPLPVRDDETNPLLDEAVKWLRPRWEAGKRLLVQSPGCIWAEVTVAALYMHLGATADEAILSLQQARPLALSQQLYQDLLRDREGRHV